MLQKPDALVVHALPGRVRFRVHGKKGDRNYFEELVGAISTCSGLEKLVINPATASVLINYNTDHTDELNVFLEKNNFFTVVDRAKQTNPVKSKPDKEVQANKEKKPEMNPEVSKVLGVGLVGWSCYKLMADGLMSPPWHVALWYGYNLLRNNLQDKQSQQT